MKVWLIAVVGLVAPLRADDLITVASVGRVQGGGTLDPPDIDSSAISAQDGGRVTITSGENGSNVFAGTEVKAHLGITSTAEFEGVLRWSYLANGRTITNGESATKTATNRSAVVVVPLQIPVVKDHVIFKTQLSVSMTNGNGLLVAELTKPIWIFPRDPFLENSSWLKQLDIGLFDPAGKTADVFTAAGIPFTRIYNLSSLDEFRTGLLIIGEGTRYAQIYSLSETLVRVAARGARVLCLAPRDGRFPVPGGDVTRHSPQGFSLRRNDIISELDERIDSSRWPPNGQSVVSRLRFRSDHNLVVLEVSAEPSGWPWLEMKFRNSGTLVVCGFGIVAHWDHGPAPRFLLARMLERLANGFRQESSLESSRRKS